MGQNTLFLDKLKISFFDNIFYWLWHYGKKMQNKNATSYPADGAMLILVFFKTSNICFFLVLITGGAAIWSIDVLKYIIENNWIIKITLFLYLFLYIVDIRPYLSKSKGIKYISEKKHLTENTFSNLSKKQQQKLKNKFFIYLIISFITTMSAVKLWFIYANIVRQIVDTSL